MDRREFIQIGTVGMGSARLIPEKERHPDASSLANIGGDPWASEWVEQKRKQRLVVVNGVIYDRIRIAPGQQVPKWLYFFEHIGPRSPCPYSGKVKGFEDSNLYQPQKLNAPEEFLVRQFLFFVHPSMHQSDVSDLRSNYAWQFFLGQRRYAGAPLLLNGPYSARLNDLSDLPIHAGKITSPDLVALGQYGQSTHDLVIIPDMTFLGSVHSASPFTLNESGNGLDLLMVLSGLWAQGVC